jgi:hypothetical protein
MEARRADTIDKLRINLVRSRLLTEQQATNVVAQFRDSLAATSLPETITAFCSCLVAAGHITTWQCEKLRKGQWKGFYDLAGFVLLDNLGNDDSTFGYYLARDTTSGELVCLKVTPPNRAKRSAIEYCVHHKFT